MDTSADSVDIDDTWLSTSVFGELLMRKYPDLRLGAALVTGVCISWGMQAEPPRNHPFIVKDGKDRVRLSCRENGDDFGLAFHDPNGRVRMLLWTRADGAPLIDCLAGDDAGQGIRIGQEGEDLWRVSLINRDGALRLEAGNDVGVSLDMRHTDQYVRIEATKLSQTLTMGGEVQGRRIRIETRANGDAACIVGDKAIGCGMASVGEKAVLWAGDDALGGGPNGLGVRIGYEAGSGAKVRVGGEASPPVLLQAVRNRGSGIQVGSDESAMIKLGIGADGAPRARIQDASASVLWQVPEPR